MMTVAAARAAPVLGRAPGSHPVFLASANTPALAYAAGGGCAVCHTDCELPQLKWQPHTPNNHGWCGPRSGFPADCMPRVSHHPASRPLTSREGLRSAAWESSLHTQRLAPGIPMWDKAASNMVLLASNIRGSAGLPIEERLRGQKEKEKRGKKGL